MTRYIEHVWPTYKKTINVLGKKQEVFYGEDICFRDETEEHEAVVHKVYFYRTFKR